jgi:hypothetical protein
MFIIAVSTAFIPRLTSVHECLISVSRSTRTLFQQLRCDSAELPQISLPKLLAYLCEECPQFCEEWSKLASRTTKLSLILYGDGITPGNPLAHQNSKKSWVWYISFLEWGPLLLSREEFWLPIAIHPVSVCNSTPGGISAMTAAILRNLSLEQGVNVMDTFFPVGLHAVVADEEALNAIWHIKGASTSMCCSFVQACGVDRLAAMHLLKYLIVLPLAVGRCMGRFNQTKQYRRYVRISNS